MYTSIDVKAAEILLERRLLRNLDLIIGETVLEVGVIKNLLGCTICSLTFFNSEGVSSSRLMVYPWGPL